MIIVTGGAGFIGSNLCQHLSGFISENDLILCDIFSSDEKWKNISRIHFGNIISPNEIKPFVEDNSKNIDAIVHLGAISDTTERNVDLIIDTNFKLSCTLWNLCAKHDIKFIYASSAATYGDGKNGFIDSFEIDYLNKLEPINAYAWSKNLFDKWVYSNVTNLNCPQVWAGLKFFNVYGPNEFHKGAMKSMVLQSYNQILTKSEVNLFKSNNPNFDDGMQVRDFIYVKDCIKIIMWILDMNKFGDILNVGTGVERSFNDLVSAVFCTMNLEPKINYIDMPESLQKQYQNFTKADIKKLRNYGYENEFTSIEDGIDDYIEYMEKRL